MKSILGRKRGQGLVFVFLFLFCALHLNSQEQNWGIEVFEEMHELKVEIDNQSEFIEEEFGDVLFSLVNLSRYIQVQPENALAKTNNKFIARFQLMEELAKKNNLNLEEMSLTEMDVFWNEAKIILKNK